MITAPWRFHLLQCPLWPYGSRPFRRSPFSGTSSCRSCLFFCQGFCPCPCPAPSAPSSEVKSHTRTFPSSSLALSAFLGFFFTYLRLPNKLPLWRKRQAIAPLFALAVVRGSRPAHRACMSMYAGWPPSSALVPGLTVRVRGQTPCFLIFRRPLLRCQKLLRQQGLRRCQACTFLTVWTTQC